MRTWIKIMLIALLPGLFSCATHKKLTPSPSTSYYNFYLIQASNFLKENDFQKAMVQLKKALALEPNSSKAYNLLGIAYFQSKNYKMAKPSFEKAISISPSYAAAYNNLGGVYFMRQQFEKAKEMFNKAISISPEIVSAHYSLGTLLLIQGKADEAFSYLSKGIALDPEYLEKNKSFITNFSSLSFSSSEMYFTYAKVFAAAGNIERTVEYLKKAEQAGFHDWERIEHEKEFKKIKKDPRIKIFIQSK